MALTLKTGGMMAAEWVLMTERMHRISNFSREELVDLSRGQQKEVSYLRRKLQLGKLPVDKQGRRRQHLKDLEERCLPENAILIGLIDARPRRYHTPLQQSKQQVVWDEV